MMSAMNNDLEEATTHPGGISLANLTEQSVLLCNQSTPDARDIYENLPLSSQVLLPLCGFVSLVTLVIFIVEVGIVSHTHPLSTNRRANTFTILAIYPVYSCTSMLALLVPKSAIINELVASVYFSYCLLTFMGQVTEYFGSLPRMLATLKGSKMRLDSFPFCCIFPCLPTVPFNEKRYRYLRMMVVQAAVLKPIMALVTIVLWSDGSYEYPEISPYSISIYISIFNMCSIFIAVYGLVQLIRVCLDPLEKFSIRAKFISLQSVMIVTMTVNISCVVLMSFGAIQCIPPLSSRDRVTRLYNIINVFLMLVLSVVGKYVYLGEADCTAMATSFQGVDMEASVGSDTDAKKKVKEPEEKDRGRYSVGSDTDAKKKEKEPDGEDRGRYNKANDFPGDTVNFTEVTFF